MRPSTRDVPPVAGDAGRFGEGFDLARRRRPHARRRRVDFGERERRAAGDAHAVGERRRGVDDGIVVGVEDDAPRLVRARVGQAQPKGVRAAIEGDEDAVDAAARARRQADDQHVALGRLPLRGLGQRPVGVAPLDVERAAFADRRGVEPDGAR